MDEKISLEAIALYGDSFADKLLKQFFNGKDKITGKEILSLSPIHQINLFVLREIFRAWKDETKKHKSLYFDHEHPEVKQALEEYMGIVSNHILVEEARFTPLLKKAVSQTLLCIFNPYDFYSLLISGKNNKLDVGAFREEIKYQKINRAPLERMLQKLEDQGVKEIAGNEAFAVLDQILEEVNFTPEDVEEYIRQFSELLPLNPEKFYVSQQPAVKAKNVPREPVPHEAKSNDVSHATKANDKKSSLNDQLSIKQTAIMDNLGKIARIKESLSINQKFMFTKVLFYGDFDSFSRAIDELDAQSDMKSAMGYLEKYAAGWDRESTEFHEFMGLVEKRFS
jgi:hypothetical protein